jgi:hypothetical protein
LLSAIAATWALGALNAPVMVLDHVIRNGRLLRFRARASYRAHARAKAKRRNTARRAGR